MSSFNAFSSDRYNDGKERHIRGARGDRKSERDSSTNCSRGHQQQAAALSSMSHMRWVWGMCLCVCHVQCWFDTSIWSAGGYDNSIPSREGGAESVRRSRQNRIEFHNFLDVVPKICLIIWHNSFLMPKRKYTIFPSAFGIDNKQNKAINPACRSSTLQSRFANTLRGSVELHFMIILMTHSIPGSAIAGFT